MPKIIYLGSRLACTLGLCVSWMLALPGATHAQPPSPEVVVFGTSLSDPGNAFALTGFIATPPDFTLDPLLIPAAPYAHGGHHLTNGATWIEQLGRSLGFAAHVRPAFQSQSPLASNYAVAGARARDAGATLNLSAQVDAFLRDVGGVAPSDAVYIIEMGA